ncbi:hypothetical protein TRAPUB_7680 [Trametes pubescens]|uniref:Uncharacterized protein n=1 Tax=Trametes pubescens TaxID=154538 RepID=A0A1M2V2P2_TRAPU|nr:hypothetical protein TRAPUB_7680 [Trametes pubescens]
MGRRRKTRPAADASVAEDTPSSAVPVDNRLWATGHKLRFLESLLEEWKGIDQTRDADSGQAKGMPGFYSRCTSTWLVMWGWDLPTEEDAPPCVEEPTAEQVADVVKYIGLSPEEVNHRKQIYRHRIKATVDVEYARLRQAAVSSGSEIPQRLPIVNAVAQRLYEAESPEFKAKLLVDAEEEYQQRMSEHQSSTARPSIPSTPEEYHSELQAASHWLPTFAEHISRRLGMNVSIFLAGPIGEHGGDPGVRSVHAGATQGLVPKLWPEFDESAFAIATKSMAKHARACYSSETCKSRALVVAVPEDGNLADEDAFNSGGFHPGILTSETSSQAATPLPSSNASTASLLAGAAAKVNALHPRAVSMPASSSLVPAQANIRSTTAPPAASRAQTPMAPSAAPRLASPAASPASSSPKPSTSPPTDTSVAPSATPLVVSSATSPLAPSAASCAPSLATPSAASPAKTHVALSAASHAMPSMTPTITSTATLPDVPSAASGVSASLTPPTAPSANSPAVPTAIPPVVRSAASGTSTSSTPSPAPPTNPPVATTATPPAVPSATPPLAPAPTMSVASTSCERREVVIPHDCPEDVRCAIRYLLGDGGWGPRWQALVETYIELERRAGFVPRSRLQKPTDDRPPEIAAWMKYHRPLIDVELDDSSAFAESWWMWWYNNQPADRPTGKGGWYTTARGSLASWSDLYVTGPNGLLLFLLAAAWWGASVQNADTEAQQDWLDAVEDMSYVLAEVLATATSLDGGDGATARPLLDRKRGPQDSPLQASKKRKV